MHVHYQSKLFGHTPKFLFLILKVLFLMKQVKHHNVFIYFTKYKSSSVTLYNLASFEKLIWRHFSSLVLSIDKTFSKSYIIPPLELTLENIVLNYCLLDTTCFTYADDNFTWVTSLRYRRLLQTSLHK